MTHVCECVDSACPAHRGIARCIKPANATLIRSDMAGNPIVRMCDACVEDALASGVFSVDEDSEDEDYRQLCETSPDIRWTRGNWYIEGQRGRLCIVNAKTGFVEIPVRYSDGSIGYDWPERVPQYVKRAFERVSR